MQVNCINENDRLTALQSFASVNDQLICMILDSQGHLQTIDFNGLNHDVLICVSSEHEYLKTVIKSSTHNVITSNNTANAKFILYSIYSYCFTSQFKKGSEIEVPNP